MSTQAWQPGTLYSPGAVVRPRTAAASTSLQPTNPSFETGTASGWTFGADLSVSAGTAYDGTYAMGLGTGIHGTRTALNNLHATVNPGQNITARCRIRNGGDASDASGFVYLNWYDASDTLLATSAGNVVNKRDTYKSSEVVAVAPAGATYVRIGVSLTRTSGSNSLRADAFFWDYAYAGPPAALVFKAVQTNAGFSDSGEPLWPATVGVQVTDNEVTWEAVATSRVTWEATPILVSGSSEPTWPTVVGASVVENNIVWEATSGQLTDARAPTSITVAIAASKVFAGDEDVIGFSATTNPLDWSTADDAGYIPFGLQLYGSNPVTALGLYRSNLIAFNSEGFQMWQVDQDPANMALLDAVPIACTYAKTPQPVSNDLVFLSPVGVRNMSIAGASTNLQAGNFGEGIDPLVLPKIKAAAEEPFSLFWPNAGQYWLIFGAEAFVLTVNGPKDMSWSRYTFPEEITDWTLHGSDLMLRAASGKVWKMDDTLTADDVYSVTDAVVLSGTNNDPAVDLSWTVAVPEVGPISSYRLYRSDDAGASYTLLATIDADDPLEYTDGALAVDTYLYYVTSVDNRDFESGPSNVVTMAIVEGAVLNNLVAVGRSATADLNVQSSAAGVTWTGTNPGNSEAWVDITWSGALGLYVAVAGDTAGTNHVITSPDGLTWTLRTTTDVTYYSVTWSPALAKFVAVGDQTAMTSPDGINWTVRTIGALPWTSVVWARSLGLFVAVGKTTGGFQRVTTSPDGVTWTQRNASATNDWTSVAWSPTLGRLVAVSSTGTDRVMTSSDALTWTARTASEANAWVGVTWSSQVGLFVAVSSNGTNRVMTSPDGITWTPRSAAAASSWSAVCWSDQAQLFVAVADSGADRVMSSPDGITWTLRTAGSNSQWAAVV